ncbi:MAG: CCA tRNA nucleotidyltransferase [Candidatus Pristimantibacillus sp.]
MSKYLALPELMRNALPVVENLLENGYETVFVGGCVRDTVMGIPIHDVDIATAAKPEQVMALFPRCIPTGLQHGTVTVLHEAGSYEITTYRKESVYENHRKPETVEFISLLSEDLLRRDLTINAMAMHPNGELYDPYQGLLDIEHKLIRCVGDPEARFQEDALRMLRAIRFSAQFSFNISYRTWKALINHRELLRYIAMERVQAELNHMLGGANPERATYLLFRCKLLSYTGSMLPAVEQLQRDWSCTEERRLKLNELDTAEERWAAIMTETGVTLEDVSRTLSALRFSGDRSSAIQATANLQADMMMIHPLTEDAQIESLRRDWTITVLKHGSQAAYLWLRIVDQKPAHLFFEQVDILKEWLLAMPVVTLKMLDLNGRQLADHLNRKPGIWTGELLQRLLLAVALKQLPNIKDKLLQQAGLWNVEDNDNDKYE